MQKEVTAVAFAAAKKIHQYAVKEYFFRKNKEIILEYHSNSLKMLIQPKKVLLLNS